MNAVSIKDLTKTYGAVAAVDGLTLDVPAGSVCGLLGPNGAGKSTTFRCLLGLARPTSGTIAVGGEPVGPKTFETLSYVPERSSLIEWMTVAQHLEWGRRSYARWDSERASELAARFKLDPRKKVKRLSKGQQTAVMLVLAFATRPEVLVLDEPASGLDPILQRVALDLIIEAAAGGSTVLFSSHQIGQVERAADRVAVLMDGKLVLTGDVDTLKTREKVVEAFFEGELPDLELLGRDARVRRIEHVGKTVRAFTNDGAESLAAQMRERGARAVSVGDLNLEEIFMGAVGAVSREGVR
jgi:ABC-2 type transport system ATP-binding protein